MSYPCKYCNLRYKSVQSLSRHNRLHHSDQHPKQKWKIYHCDLCDYHDINKTCYNWHLTTKKHNNHINSYSQSEQVYSEQVHSELSDSEYIPPIP